MRHVAWARRLRMPNPNLIAELKDEVTAWRRRLHENLQVQLQCPPEGWICDWEEFACGK